MENKLLESVEALKQLIEDDEILQHYRQMGIKVHQNEAVKALHDAYIAKQKEVVKLTHYHKKEAALQAEQELKQLEDQLFEHPLLNNYLEYQTEINELAQSMSHLIQSKVDEHLSNH